MSNQAISDMTQFKNLIGMYLDLLDEYEKSYNMLKLHSDEEVNWYSGEEQSPIVKGLWILKEYL